MCLNASQYALASDAGSGETCASTATASECPEGRETEMKRGDQMRMRGAVCQKEKRSSGDETHTCAKQKKAQQRKRRSGCPLKRVGRGDSGGCAHDGPVLYSGGRLCRPRKGEGRVRGVENKGPQTASSRSRGKQVLAHTQVTHTHTNKKGSQGSPV